MDIPADLQILLGFITIASIGSVLLLVVLMVQLLRGRVRAALRTTIATGLLVAGAFMAALPLGVTPIADVMPPP
ncbi:hypothetical protein MRBLWH7_002400 [Microbacterium sp. LWH7-1.2]|uniref:hypothetical protein n=1 Tax=Microbacterium sp. LWH7-1.2 TaxID=3135257 RepID=UPI003139D02B